MEDVADTGIFVRIGLQSTDFEDQLAIAVIEDANLGVGRLAVVDVTESPADANDTLGQLIFFKPPTSNVHFVDALIAQVAVAVVPKPMPVIVDGAMFGLAMGRLEWSRSAPEVVVHSLGRLLSAVHFPY